MTFSTMKYINNKRIKKSKNIFYLHVTSAEVFSCIVKRSKEIDKETKPPTLSMLTF